ncbi:hypothetical protein CHCC15325_3140 [Bacillus licheniformis]|uniref:hypothetical protein n=1 Tax=Bacillus TaxID=1386 RepID=UPI000BA7A561|nr:MULTISPECIES: hypothetical protein [Bacillus]MDE1362856.1 hypothetical protein [Bacillus paralicheniformis]PAE55289.1 hypothetical protein CHH93_12495 [Bacillus licheniformis]TWK93491.1 hypothetical protein CHCC20325_2015 [Bacillus licheniformis]TWL55472.1 hypothetical protein CHCC15325_3140 [Bacillus licheniformis]TWL77189.1 hypothetical protein CHCC15311_3842 [Bacillus licheniformis]
MELSSLIKEYNIPIVEVSDRNYWLVRTQSGEYYNEFYYDEFIAISWNELNTIEDFKTGDKAVITKKIQDHYPDSIKPGLIYNQIKRFISEIKIGDIVMIPSINSTVISFGIVESEVYIKDISETSVEEGVCPFTKRRKVKWIKTVKRDELDPFLYRMMQSHHTINNANDYADIIDRTLHSFYLKNDAAHLVLQVKQKKDIPAIDLVNSIGDILESIPFINDPENSERIFDKSVVDLKLRVQSPGIMEFISTVAPWAVIGLGVLLHYTIGGTSSGKYSNEKSQTAFELNGSTDGLLEKILKFKKHQDKQKLLELKERHKKAAEKLDIKTPEETEKLNLKTPEEENTPKSK